MCYNCVINDNALLALTKDKCVQDCGTDIRNYAATECIYEPAGCTALDEYVTGFP